ncbi:MAG: hypothetical protein J6T37_02290 [Bacteroidales bacterium]|nr:hypothetical protein [Bacteroidales bacterium]MBO7528688.1 hypothetical protein [Bacteroidales bacterium]
MNEEQKAILIYLNNNAIGYENRKTSTQIREDLNLESGGVTNEHVRDLIRDLIINYQACIGSLMWGNGYWIIKSEDELNKVCESLENRANSIKYRAQALRNNWQKHNNG